jgi:hypothetical protein
MEQPTGIDIKLLIDGKPPSRQPAELLKYFLENDEFEEADHILFILFFNYIHNDELTTSKIISSMKVGHLNEISIETVFDFFDNFLQIEQNGEIEDLFINYLITKEDMPDYIEAVQIILAEMSLGDDKIHHLLDFFLPILGEAEESIEKTIIEIVFDLLRTASSFPDTINMSTLIERVISLDMDEEIGIRLFLITKLDLFDDSVKKQIFDFINTEISLGIEIAEYTNLFQKSVIYWEEDNPVIMNLLKSIIELNCEKAILDLSELVVTLLKALDRNACFWINESAVLCSYFSQETISNRIFNLFIIIIGNLSEEQQVGYKLNEELIEKGRSYRSNLISSFFDY